MKATGVPTLSSQDVSCKLSGRLRRSPMTKTNQRTKMTYVTPYTGRRKYHSRTHASKHQPANRTACTASKATSSSSQPAFRSFNPSSRGSRDAASGGRRRPAPATRVITPTSASKARKTPSNYGARSPRRRWMSTGSRCTPRKTARRTSSTRTSSPRLHHPVARVETENTAQTRVPRASSRQAASPSPMTKEKWGRPRRPPDGPLYELDVETVFMALKDPCLCTLYLYCCFSELASAWSGKSSRTVGYRTESVG